MLKLDLGPDINGYGRKDREMAAALRRARTPDEADRIARAGGFKDAPDAVNWLKGRTDGYVMTAADQRAWDEAARVG